MGSDDGSGENAETPEQVSLTPDLEPSAGPRRTPPAASPLTMRCPADLAGDEALDRMVVQRFSGAPLGWGSTPDELARECGETRHLQNSVCQNRFVEVRGIDWAPLVSIPERGETTLAFHRERGLYEVMVYSQAEPARVAEEVANALGRYDRLERGRYIWDRSAGDAGARVHLKVTGLPASNPRGRSAIRIHAPDVSTAFRAEMAAAGCR